MKKVIITGHSKGLGYALAQTLLKQGFDVLGLSRSHSAGLDGVQQLSLDLSDSTALLQWINSGELKRFLEGAAQAILINNSGSIKPIGPLGKQTNEDIISSVGLNVCAPLLLSNAFVEITEDIPDRRILHISSGAGRVAYSGWSVYCATKAALDHHARTVHEDGIANLRISSLAPGIVDTGMQADIRSSSADQFPRVEVFRGFKTKGQLVSPEETAAGIVEVLLSDKFGQDSITDVRDH